MFQGGNKMGNVSFSTDVIDFLRRFPPVHRALRLTFSAFFQFLRDTLRFCSRPFIRFGPPAGVFRLVDDLLANHIEGRIVLEAQEIPLVEKGSVLEKTGWDLRLFYPWPIVWARIPAARLVGPSLALIREDKRLAVESVWNERCYRDDPSFTCLALPPVTNLAGSWTSIVGRYCDAYFHWLTDAVPRLACLREFPPHTRILVPASLRPYQSESLDLLGLTSRARPTPERHLRIENYYFSGPTAMTGVKNPYGVNFLRQSFLPHAVSRSRGARVFVWREGKTREIKNQGELASFFQKHDWIVVDLEKLSFREQIGLFQEANAICAAHGAALTNLIWCNPGTKVLEIFSDRFLNGCYETIARLVNLDHRYLILPGDSSFRITVPIRLIEEHLDWLNEDRAANN
jgi:hypothetical protein